MAAPSLSTIRDNILTSINAICTGGQSYGIDGRQLTRADLPDLFDALSQIDARIRRTSDATNGVRHAEFNDPEGGKRSDGRGHGSW